MTNRLAPIIQQKQREVAQLQRLIQDQPQHAIAKTLRGEIRRKSVKNFKESLQGPNLSVIAEIKRKSPSKGVLAAITDPLVLAQTYMDGGADALSILTDQAFFGGELADVERVAASNRTPPILRKDFVIDVSQIAEAIVAGADAILAIVAVLGKDTAAILTAATTMGIDVLVEVHTLSELKIALDSGAEMIGINNRDLSTFIVQVERAFELRHHIPSEIIAVAESGITHPKLACDYHEAGFDAVLIGEALVTAHSPAQFIESCRHG